MSSRKNVLNTSRFTQRVAAFVLTCTLALTALISVPAFAEEAGNVGTTAIGLRVINSSDSQYQSPTGSTRVGLRVTNSHSTDPITVRVTFHGNGGTWPDGNDTYWVDVPLLQPTSVPDPIRLGYEFDDWSSIPNGDKVELPTSTVEPADWYARWKLVTYQIAYTAVSGGTNPTSNPTSYDVTQSIALADATPSNGYQFDGWTCEKLNITKPRKNLSVTAGATGNLTFVPVFSPAKFTVTFNSKGGSSVDSQEVAYLSKVPEPTKPTRPGYKFDGWYTDERFATPWNFNTDTMPAKAMTLYAKWSEHIVCDVPVSTLLQVDAKGDITDITGTTPAFVSKTDAPLEVTSATSTLLAGANTLFPDEAAKKGVAILIKPEGGMQKSIPLETTTPVVLGFRIGTNATLPVAFGLNLPATARLNYLANDGTAEIASISYTVSLATS